MAGLFWMEGGSELCSCSSVSSVSVSVMKIQAHINSPNSLPFYSNTLPPALPFHFHHFPSHHHTPSPTPTTLFPTPLSCLNLSISCIYQAVAVYPMSPLPVTLAFGDIVWHVAGSGSMALAGHPHLLLHLSSCLDPFPLLSPRHFDSPCQEE